MIARKNIKEKNKIVSRWCGGMVNWCVSRNDACPNTTHKIYQFRETWLSEVGGVFYTPPS